MDQEKKTTKPAEKPAAKAAAKPTAKPAEKPSAKPSGPAGKVAAILIRTTIRPGTHITDTLIMLNLRKKLTCSVFDNTPSVRGMLNKVKDYVAYGEIDAETLKLLETKRQSKDKEGKPKGVFHLSPPRGGFERKGIKHSFTQGGASGYRGAKINDLIKKMI